MTQIDRRGLLLGMATAAATTIPGLVSAKDDSGPGVLPKGMSRANFNRAVTELRAIVGEDYVFADPATVIPYQKIYVPDPTHKHVCSGAVAPASV
jgi:4-cresol dehydrogenase (hydroxylating)